MLLLRDLLKLCETGDNDAAAELVSRFRPWALDFASAITDDHDLAEDVVQEAFITAITHLRDLREPDAFAGWFRQIIRSQAGRILRKSRELPVEQNDLSASGECSAQDRLQAEELRMVVRKALQLLPNIHRDAVEMFYLEEMNCASISDILDVPLGTVKRRLFDARARLRDLLLGYVQGDEPDRKDLNDQEFPL
ncbi:sigma-70 family RNA polymerase sigma factor [bacterium]|nr:sigma-70 family RNA polymerase sigma factor [bacterium]